MSDVTKGELTREMVVAFCNRMNSRMYSVNEGVEVLWEYMSALRLRVETAEKDAAEAYAKGQKYMREISANTAFDIVTPEFASDSKQDGYMLAREHITDAILALPIKERP